MSEKMSQTDVLEWLAENYPELHAAAELDRAWVWLAGINLQGADKKEMREAIGKRGIGFRYAPQGHTLPSGKVSHWGHACDRPMPFKRKGGGGGKKGSPAKKSASELSDAELLEMLG